MKRVCIFMIVLVLCVNVSLIASGGKEAPSEGPISIQYWHYQPTPIRKEIEAENIKLFEERNPGITVEYVPVPWEKAHAKYITSIAAGNAADVGMIPDFWISEFAAMGALLPELVLFAYIQRFLIRGLSSGAVKG